MISIANMTIRQQHGIIKPANKPNSELKKAFVSSSTVDNG